MAREQLLETVQKTKDHFIVATIGGDGEKTLKLPRKLKFTQSAVDALPFEAGPQRMHYDEDLPGFYLGVGKQTKTYYVQAWVQKIRDNKRLKVGVHGRIKTDEARKQARRLLVALQDGDETLIQPQRGGNGAQAGSIPPEAAAPAETVTSEVEQVRRLKLSEAFADYLKSRPLKDSTRDDYEQLVRRSFADWLDQPLLAINKQLVRERHAANKERFGHPYADYGMRVLSGVINHVAACYEDAEGRSCIPSNPVQVLSRLRLWDKQRRRTNIVKNSDLPYWFRGLAKLRQECDGPSFISIGCDYLEFVLFTGLRRNEAATLKWEDVDLAEKTMTVTNTKNSDTHVLPLTEYLLEILKRRRAESDLLGSDFVFPSSRKPKQGLGEPRFVAKRLMQEMNRLKALTVGKALREEEKVKFSIHDLRRTFATAAESLDLSYYALKKLLNHRMSGDVTSGYQIISVNRLRKPMEQITEHFLSFRPTTERKRILTGESEVAQA